MTVQYNSEIATATFLGLIKLLLHWKGSVFKLMWGKFLWGLVLYYGTNCIYWYLLGEDGKTTFRELVSYCARHCNRIPVTFVLGFYVASIYNRWWNKFTTIPWPSKLAILVLSHVRGEENEVRMLRRTLVRYTALGFVLTTRSICPGVKLRFPTYDHVTKAGFMLPHEQAILENTPTHYNKYYFPFIWACSLVARARLEGRIKDEFGMMAVCEEIHASHRKCLALFNFDWVAIPLAYTQLVMIAVNVYTYGMMIGQQYTNSEVGFYFPFFVFLQYVFYHGWMKVAEVLMNPFGIDDDDFEVNAMIDTFLQTSYLIVDDMYAKYPSLEKDRYWNILNIDLPHTLASIQLTSNSDKMRSANFAALSQRVRRRSSARPQGPQVTLSEEPGVSEDVITNTEGLATQIKHLFTPGRQVRIEDDDDDLDPSGQAVPTDGSSMTQEEMEEETSEDRKRGRVSWNFRKGSQKRTDDTANKTKKKKDKKVSGEKMEDKAEEETDKQRLKQKKSSLSSGGSKSALSKLFRPNFRRGSTAAAADPTDTSAEEKKKNEEAEEELKSSLAKQLEDLRGDKK